MDPITAIILSIIGAIATGGAGAATTHYLSKKKNKSRVSLELRYQLSILILAIQETGKTTFIRKVFNDREADPTQRTKTIRRYKQLVSLPENADTGCEIYITDYDGGDFKQLSDNIKEGLAPVDTTVVGIFVDTTPKSDVIEIDDERADRHRDAWNRASLQFILGQIPHAKYFFVYVNKADLVPLEKLVEYPAEFQGIVDAIKEATGDPSTQTDTFLGSLEKGEHIPTIMERAMQYRVRANHV